MCAADAEALRSDNEVGRVEIPLRTLHLTAGRLNALTVTIPRSRGEPKERPPSHSEMPSSSIVSESEERNDAKIAGGHPEPSVLDFAGTGSVDDIMRGGGASVQNIGIPKSTSTKTRNLLTSSSFAARQLQHLQQLAKPKACTLDLEVKHRIMEAFYLFYPCRPTIFIDDSVLVFPLRLNTF